MAEDHRDTGLGHRRYQTEHIEQCTNAARGALWEGSKGLFRALNRTLAAEAARNARATRKAIVSSFALGKVGDGSGILGQVCKFEKCEPPDFDERKRL